jgi:hypothetical protein
LREVRRRLIGLCCCCCVAVGCGGSGAGPAEGDAAVEAEPCAAETSMPRSEVHLGDGTTDYHYFVIRDYLREFPGSEAETREIEGEEQAAATSERTLKPPSANIFESEFSHLLGLIADANGGIGAAVFDTHGLMVAATGVVLEGIVLPSDRLARLEKAGDESPVEVHYTCASLREQAESCDRRATRGPPCWALRELADDCRDPITAYYRPVLDHERESQFLGVGMLVVRDEPPCGASEPGER